MLFRSQVRVFTPRLLLAMLVLTGIAGLTAWCIISLQKRRRLGRLLAAALVAFWWVLIVYNDFRPRRPTTRPEILEPHGVGEFVGYQGARALIHGGMALLLLHLFREPARRFTSP